jgi:hypothetical protein
MAHDPSLFRVWVDNAGIEPANFGFAEPTLKLSKITGWSFCDFRFTLTGVQLNHSNPNGLPSSLLSFPASNLIQVDSLVT